MEGKTGKAISLLEEAVPKLRVRKDWPEYFFGCDSLAKAWLQAGKVENALRVLEDASQQKSVALRGKIFWMGIQLRLADLYRRQDREAEAEKIEDELRKLLVYADSDFWIVKELNRRKETNTHLR